MRNSAEANNIREMIIIVVGEPDVHGTGSQRSFEWQTSYLITGLRSYLKQNVRYFLPQNSAYNWASHTTTLYTCNSGIGITKLVPTRPGIPKLHMLVDFSSLDLPKLLVSK